MHAARAWNERTEAVQRERDKRMLHITRTKKALLGTKELCTLGESEGCHDSALPVCPFYLSMVSRNNYF